MLSLQFITVGCVYMYLASKTGILSSPISLALQIKMSSVFVMFIPSYSSAIKNNDPAKKYLSPSNAEVEQT